MVNGLYLYSTSSSLNDPQELYSTFSQSSIHAKNSQADGGHLTDRRKAAIQSVPPTAGMAGKMPCPR